MRERLGILLIVAFVVLDVVLVSLALRRPDPPTGGATAPATATETPTATPTKKRARSSSPSPSAVPETGPLLLAVGTDGSLLRATRGSCRAEEAPLVDSSRADGRRLGPTEVDGLTQVLAVDVGNADDLRIVGLDGECATTTFTSTDKGASWTAQGDGEGAWSRLASRRREAVTSPDGTVSTPCVPRAVAEVDRSVARLLCDDGDVLGTSDTGGSWIMLGSLPSAVDLAFTSPSRGWGLTSRESCPAAVVRTTDGGSSWQQIACLDGGEPRAIAAQGETIVVQAGAALARSTDDGTSFSPVG